MSIKQVKNGVNISLNSRMRQSYSKIVSLFSLNIIYNENPSNNDLEPNSLTIVKRESCMLRPTLIFYPN